jgi:hypothetical protein
MLVQKALALLGVLDVEEGTRRRAHEEAEAIFAVVRMSRDIARHVADRAKLERRILEVIEHTTIAFGEISWSHRLDTYVHEAQSHTGWMEDLEKLGDVTPQDIEAGPLVAQEHPGAVRQLGLLHRPHTTSKGRSSFASYLVAKVVLGRWAKLDPQLVVVGPGLDSYCTLGCSDFYKMVREMTTLLRPLSEVGTARASATSKRFFDLQ